MLSDKDCSNINFTFRDSKPGEKFIIAKDQALESLGTIIGCAIYFKEHDEALEQIVATGVGNDFSIVEEFLYDVMETAIYRNNGDYTRYGYITDKGFFLDKILARKVYEQFCHTHKLLFKPFLRSAELYTHQINWDAIVTHLRQPS